MTKRQSAEPSQRQLRVGEELRHGLVHALDRAGFRDPALEGVAVTVTEVRISPDLRNATAFVLPLGGAEPETVTAALNRASGYLRGLVAREVQLRYMPRLGFKTDDSFDAAGRIDDLIRRSHPAEPSSGGEDGA